MKKYILGTDWWTDCDDAVAMRILARAHKSGSIRLEGICINACMKYSVASLDGFLNTEGVSGISLGIDREATDFGGKPPYQENLVQFSDKHLENVDAEQAVSLYRRLLAESAGKLEIIEIGYLQVIAALLESGKDEISSKTGVELVREKVSKIWVMAGKWDEERGRENNFARNKRSRCAAEIFCRQCPVPVTFLGFEAGADVITGGNLNKDDILHRVLCDHGSPNGRSSWDPMLVVLALIGDEAKAGYDFVSGTATVDALTGENKFIPSEKGLHKYVVKKEANEYYKNMINELL